MPVDVVCLFLAGAEFRNYSILLIDEFYRFNGRGQEEIEHGKKEARKSLEILGSVYGLRPDIIACSDFMHSEEYRDALEETEEKIKERNLAQEIMEAVPERYRASAYATKYIVNEIACTEFMRRNGADVKVGPTKEKPCDKIMRNLGMELVFAYVIDAYAVGSQQPEGVVHYVARDRGRTGQRIFLDKEDHAKTKLIMGPEEASRYLLRLASAAGKRIGKPHMTPEEIDSKYGKQLKKAARHFVMENIIRPYTEAVGHD